jgi:hypothetical protein
MSAHLTSIEVIMTSIRNSLQSNRRMLFIVVGLLAAIIAFGAKFYFDQRKENRALRIKILSMSENKRSPKPWTQLIAQPKITTATNTQVVTTSTTVPSETPATDIPVSDQDTQILAMKLDRQMRRVKNAEVTTLDNNISIANEIISREPDSYGAYKAKLISLLVKEGKFSNAVDETEVESVLESMAQFNISSDKLARREAALMAVNNADIQNNETRLEEVARQREIIESQLSTLDINSPELVQLNEQAQLLDSQEAELLGQINSLEESLAASTNQLVNEDVIEIPFMRMLAKGNYEAVADNAQGFIDQFPSSPNGYFYLIRSMELLGQKEEARNVIQTAQLNPEDRNQLLQRLEQESAQDPKSYWQKLNF